MVDLTILELHLHDGVEFAPRLGDTDPSDAASDEPDEETEPKGTATGKLAAVVLGLVVLAAGAAALARRAGEDDEIEVAVEEMN